MSYNVLIAMGMHKAPHPKTVGKVYSMADQFAKLGNGVQVHTIPGAVLLAMRTRMAELALNDPSVTHLLVVDDDMDFPLSSTFNPLARLLSLDKDVVGGLATTRSMGAKPIVAKESEDGFAIYNAYSPELLLGTKPFRVDFTGFGFCLISRKTLVRVRDGCCRGNTKGIFKQYSPWCVTVARREELLYTAEYTVTDAAGQPTRAVDAFIQAIDAMQDACDTLGEDFSFCRRVRQCGLEVWCDPKWRLHHIGDYPYSIDDWWARHPDNKDR